MSPALSLEWQIAYLKSAEVICATTRGNMTMPDLQRLALAVLDEARHHGVRRFLVDHRAMTPQMTTFEIYEVPSVLTRLGFQHTDRVAFLYSADSPNREDFLFYETRAFNQGFDHRMFTDLNEALSWLRGCRAEP
jgi:hypothetical protein